MYIAIIFTIIGLLVAILIVRDSWDPSVFSYISSAIIGMCLGFFCGGVVSVIGGRFRKSIHTEHVTHNIVAIGDGSSGVNGSIFLGTGSFSDKLCYMYYRETADGGIVRRKIDAGLTIVYETDSTEQPRVEIDIVSDKGLGTDWWTGCNKCGYQTYRVYIPEGSIIKDMMLDNK